MRCRTFCFNPTLARNYLRRFWPLPLAVLGVVILRLLLPMLNVVQRGAVNDELSGMLEVARIYNASGMMIVLMAGAAFLSAALTFRHLHGRREIQFYHALPLTRWGLYGTSYLTGFGLIALPLLLGILLCMLLAAVSGWSAAVLPLLKLFGAGIAALLIFYSMAVLACCMAGQTFGAVLIYAGMHGAVMIIVGCAGNLAALFMPGIHFDNFLVGFRQWLTPVAKLLEAVTYRSSAVSTNGITNNIGPSVPMVDGMYAIPSGFSQPLTLVIYGIAGAALAVLAGVIYQTRRAENAGEMTAFPLVRSLCKIFGALVVLTGGAYVTLSGGLFQEEIPFGAVVCFVLGFGALGWLAAEMVVQKTLRVFRKKTAISCGILLAMLLALIGVGKLDLLHTVHYVPQAGDVAHVTACYGGGDAVTMAPEDAAALHEAAIAHLDVLTNNTYGHAYTSLEFNYTLKNDRHVVRRYCIREEYDEEGVRQENPISQAVLEMLQTPEYNRQTWFGDWGSGVTKDNFCYGSVQSYSQSARREDYDVWSVDLTAAEAVTLYEAICRDIAEKRLKPCGFDTPGPVLGSVDFSCYLEDYSEARYGSYSRYRETAPMTYVSVTVVPGMENTTACLREMGLSLEPEE